MNTKIATVETLTASVNVLQMGGRQVTLGVYKQLDRASGLMKIMGRVRTNEKVYRLEMIGVEKATGRLVRDGITYRQWDRYVESRGEEWAAGMDAIPLIILAGA